MKYTVEAAARFAGKRVAVSLRECAADGTETLTGFWGIIESAKPDGLLLRIEGGDREGHWMMPPDLEALQPAEYAAYQLRDGGDPVTNVDYLATYLGADSLDQLPIDEV